jgi:GNAT superfamily N-acetyltransferase
MTDPQPLDSVTVNRAVDGFFDVFARMAERTPGAYLRRGAAGTRLMFMTLPVPAVNGVWVDSEPELGEVEAFAKEMSATGLPWSLQVRGEVSTDLTELAARYGLTATEKLPLLVRDIVSSPVPPSPIPDGAVVRKVPAAEWESFANALGAGLGMPRELADKFAAPELLDGPGMTAFVLDLHGEIVATGFNVRAGDYVGMFSGSVPPQHRGNGYYRALVTARLADAVGHGARYAVTQNSPMSRPLYESLGFPVVETWTYLTPPE